MNPLIELVVHPSHPIDFEDLDAYFQVKKICPECGEEYTGATCQCKKSELE